MLAAAALGAPRGAAAEPPPLVWTRIEGRVVRRTSVTEYVEYDHFGTPFVTKDRDFVVANRMEDDPARRASTIRMHSVTDPAAPPTSYVRGEQFSSTFVLTADGTGTFMSGDVRCDPRGSTRRSGGSSRARSQGQIVTSMLSIPA